jgi:GT2 family glycosyltransferase
VTEAHASDAARRSRSKLGIVTEERAGPIMEQRTVAVVLNFRTASETVQAVQALAASRLPVAATIVVDNASGDGSVAALRATLGGAHLVQAERNEGFAAGCNRGIREAMRLGADRILLLNSDARVKPDALGALELALDQNPRVGIVGPMVVERADPGMVQSLGMRYTLTTGRMRHHAFGRRHDALTVPALREVDGVSGCAMLVRRAVFEQVGLFFEDYFFGFEDLDLCLRARAAGFATACVGSAVVAHEGSVSIGRASPQRIYYATRNHLLLAARTSPPGSSVARSLRTVAIAAFNLVFALTRAPVPRRAGLSAFRRALADHRARRYGRGEEL